MNVCDKCCEQVEIKYEFESGEHVCLDCYTSLSNKYMQEKIKAYHKKNEIVKIT